MAVPSTPTMCCKQNYYYLLPERVICLLHALSDTSSVSSIASPCEEFLLLLIRMLGILKLSLEECTKFIFFFRFLF